MKNEKIFRDPYKQNDFKKRLKQESKEIYGVEKCYASHKQYKGLIASHIKSYKLCYLENDLNSEYDLNNGLLLSKSIDDYFDKWLITFDDNGNIIFSDIIPDEIKEEFKPYHLDEIVYNSTRKEYMKIHRSIFYYKNYIQAAENNYPYNISDSYTIPYCDNGIKVYHQNVIIENNGIWEICPTHKVKNTFVSRSDKSIDFKYYISNADFLNKLIQQSEYIIDSIPEGFNCPDYSFDLNDIEIKRDSNSFKLNTTNYNLDNKKPEMYLGFLKTVFENDEDAIELFRRIVKVSMIGNGYDKNVVFSGNYFSVKLIFQILMKVFGSYIYEFNSLKDLKNKKSCSVPNCCIVIFDFNNNSTYSVNSEVFKDVLENKYFLKTPINIDKYTPFYYINLKNNYIDNSVFFNLKGSVNEYNADCIVSQEGGSILNWFLTAKEEIKKDIETPNNSFENHTPNVLIIKPIIDWIKCNCITNDTEKTSATILFNDYSDYCIRNGFTKVSMKKFCIVLSDHFSKRRNGKGVYYCGIRLNK